MSEQCDGLMWTKASGDSDDQETVMDGIWTSPSAHARAFMRRFWTGLVKPALISSEVPRHGCDRGELGRG